MKEQVEQALSVIVGMPLWSMGRAADLEWFHFGPRRIVSARRGAMKEVGAYALHVQCAWRIVGPSGVVVGSRDRFYPSGDDPYDEPPDFDWDQPGTNRRDQRTEALIMARVGHPLIVEAVQADGVGSFRLTLSDGFAFEVFTDDSLEAEHWRFFRPSVESDHFVITGRGIEA